MKNQVNNYYRVVKELIYIQKGSSLTPIFGKKIGVYDSIGSKVLLPSNNKDWSLADNLLKQPVVNTKKATLKNSTSKNLPPVKLSEIYFALTEACNLSCPGCAVGADKIKLKDARFLSDAKVFTYLEAFFKSSAQKKMFETHIKWAGGEPLIGKAFKLIESAQTSIAKLEKKYHVKSRQTILTNGVYISTKVTTFCKKNDISLSVSLWGTAKYQDKMRRPRSKKESYITVVKNLEKLHNAKILFNVNYVLAPDNAIDFPDFVTSMWDLNSSKFIGKNWVKPRAIPLGIAFFRPPIAYKQELTKNLYRKMEIGLRCGFTIIANLINKGIPLPPLHKFDYLDLFHTRLTTCGSGRAYIAAGLDGVADCHQGLIDKKNNFEQIKNNNLFDLVEKYHWEKPNKLSVNTMKIPQKMTWLKYHGIAGCPRLSKLENSNQMGYLSSISKLYANIADEILSLEAMRQLKMQENKKE